MARKAKTPEEAAATEQLGDAHEGQTLQEAMADQQQTPDQVVQQNRRFVPGPTPGEVVEQRADFTRIP